MIFIDEDNIVAMIEAAVVIIIMIFTVNQDMCKKKCTREAEARRNKIDLLESLVIFVVIETKLIKLVQRIIYDFITVMTVRYF